MLKNSYKFRKLCAAAKGLQIYNSNNVLLDRNSRAILNVFQIRGKRENTNVSTLFTPIAVKPTADDINVGAELTGAIGKSELLKVLTKFYQKREVKQLLSENGLDSKYL